MSALDAIRLATFTPLGNDTPPLKLAVAAPALAVMMLPLSTSLTLRVPLMAAMSCALESPRTSVMAAGEVMGPRVGAWLLLTFSVKVSVAVRLPESVATTARVSSCAAVPAGGVPLKVLVAGLKVSQLGSAAPPASVAL